MANMKILSQAWLMTWRDWRAGELRLLALALVIAVAAVTAVGFFVDRLRLGLERDATQLLGGDVVISSDRPISSELRDRALAAGLLTVETVTFPSMVQHPFGRDERGDAPVQLSAIKAVSSGYPLRGSVRIAHTMNGPDVTATDIPAPGTIWVDQQLVVGLGVQVGDLVTVGESQLRVSHVITFEPDRGAGFINFAPRVIMRLDELGKTRLVQIGSRVTYRLLVAGNGTGARAAAIKKFRQYAQSLSIRGQQVESLEAGRPEMQQALQRAQQFLSLVALLTVMLAAVAVALAARRYSARHTDACAIMRCLGSSTSTLVQIFGWEFLWVGVLTSLLGSAIGYAAHFVLLENLGGLVRTNLPTPSVLPAVQGFVTGLILLAGFALPPLLQLRRVSPLRVLRRDLGWPAPSAVLTYGLALAAFWALLLWFAGDLELGLVVGSGFIIGLTVFMLVTLVGLRLLTPLQRSLSRTFLAFRFAFAGAFYRTGSTAVQVVALAVGLMALLLLSMTRTDLIQGWRGSAPADAPNRFVINIQPEQRQPFNEKVQALGLPAPKLLPMVRGRLVAVKGKAVSLENYEGRARRLVDREFNLSYMNEMPSHNLLLEGKWYAPEAQEISVEDGLMKELNLSIGDTLRFEIAGQSVDAKISSRRKVQWDSFQVNFFVIFPTAMLEPWQQSFITSFRMPADHEIGSQLLSAFPNLTIVDTSAILRQVQAVLDQVISAVEFLFIFSLLAGVLVLYAALASTRDERLCEAALLRALGASKRQLFMAQISEFIFIGALSGALAALGATSTGWALATYVFQFHLSLNPWVFLVGSMAGALLALLGGWVSLRQVLKHPPLATLRAA
jgi:putative ABC transport system permease protein